LTGGKQRLVPSRRTRRRMHCNAVGRHRSVIRIVGRGFLCSVSRFRGTLECPDDRNTSRYAGPDGMGTIENSPGLSHRRNSRYNPENDLSSAIELDTDHTQNS